MSSAVSRESASPKAHERVFELLIRQASRGAVLDIPCGSGAFTRRLVAHGYTVTAADIAPHPAMPAAAAFHAADMNLPLPFGAGSFDAVVSIEGIEHIERPFDFLRECARILKPGGNLLLTTPNISSLRSRWRWFLTGFHNKAKYPLDETAPAARHHINMMSYPELRYILHTSGLRITHVDTNRVKAASWVYLPWFPVQRIASRLVLEKGAKSEDHRKAISEVGRHMSTVAVLFGETLIIAARKN